jgi:hypothetical protein
MQIAGTRALEHCKRPGGDDVDEVSASGTLLVELGSIDADDDPFLRKGESPPEGVGRLFESLSLNHLILIV